MLYWLCTNLISIWQQYEYIYKPHKLKQQGGGDLPAGSTPVGAELTPPGPRTTASSAQQGRVKQRKKKRK